jgi:hypothetical protein
VQTADWPHAVKGVHFLWLPIPAHTSLSVLLFILHAKWWTFFCMLAVIGALTYLHIRGRTVPWLMRRMKLYLRGGVVQARPVWFRRRAQHLGSFDLIDLKGN